MLIQGFPTWKKRDFNKFISACAKYGRNDIKNISSEMKGKSEEEVQRYAKVFNGRHKELSGKSSSDRVNSLDMIDIGSYYIKPHHAT